MREQAQEPHWEVTKLSLEYIDLPMLSIKGLLAADTSSCPTLDPCGSASAKGCSKCPKEGMFNDGCVCRENPEGRSAPPGLAMTADTSACPVEDPCGTQGCAKCPDPSWMLEGCVCRQPPMSFKDFTDAVGNFFSGIFGMHETVMRMGVLTEVAVFNPADMGAFAQQGSFNITYRGSAIGSARTQPVEVAARSAATVSATVQIDKVSETVGMRMLQDILNTHGLLPVQAEGSLIAVAGPIQVHCRVVCDLVADVMALPKAQFTKKSCQYAYSL